MEIDSKLFDQIYKFILDHTHEFKDPRFIPNPALRERANKLLPLLPTPIDQDLIEARKICAEHYPDTKTYLTGTRDHWGNVQAVLAGIKRGRELVTPLESLI